MAKLKNSHHEAFARHLFRGRLSKSDAYRDIFPKSKCWSDKSVHEAASKLAAKVAPRLAEMNAAAEKDIKIERNHLIRYLLDVVDTAAGEVTEMSPLCQEISETPGKKTLKMPSKMDAVEKLLKIGGIYAPEKHDMTYNFKPDEKVLTLLRD